MSWWSTKSTLEAVIKIGQVQHCCDFGPYARGLWRCASDWYVMRVAMSDQIYFIRAIGVIGNLLIQVKGDSRL